MKNYYFTLLALFVFVLFANGQNNIKLKFDKNGEFKIVQFTDTHIDFINKKNLNVYDIVKKIINTEDPDFVILTGDIITQNDPQTGYLRFAHIFEKAKIPWAVIFGNHDGESNVPREEIAKYLITLPYCLNKDDGKDDGVLGASNFVLPVYGKNSKTEALLYCLDSHNRSPLSPKVEGYGWFDISQINWYLKQSRSYTKENGGEPLPALAFFHIPLPEYTQAWENKINPPIGVKNEDECSPDINSGMYTAMLTGGDVMGTFVGHDHINDYIGVYHGMALAYGRVTKVMKNPDEDPLAGGRVIVLKEGKRTFETGIRDMDGKRELDCNWPDSFNKKEEEK